MKEWVSPIDRHRHFGDAARAQCAVCCLEAERDRLRQEVANLALEGARLRAVLGMSDAMLRGIPPTDDQLAALLAERNQLRNAIAEIVFHLGPPPPSPRPRDPINGDGIVGYNEVPDLVAAVAAERDRLKAVVEADDWAGVAMKIMLTIDGGRRTWADPVDEQIMAAVAELEAERDQLRTVAAAAHELLDEDRTSWSPEHERLLAALAALDGNVEER